MSKPKRNVKAINILVRAHNAIAKARGWAQGTFLARRCDGSVCFCAAGAMRYAAHGDAVNPPLDNDEYHIAANALADAAGIINFGGRIYAWNDANGRKRSEVLAAFKKAIRSLRGGK